MTLTLRCLRCGDLAELDPAEENGWGLCYECWLWSPGDLRAAKRWRARWQKNQERHPTYKALSAALDAMERAEPGRMSDPSGMMVET